MFDDKTFVKALIKCALDENLYGKRKRDTKLQCIENARRSLVLVFGPTVPDAPLLLDWLEENKPIKSTVKRATVDKLAHDHVSGSMVGDTERWDQRDYEKPYIVISAQNNTALASGFLDALKIYAEVKNADILCIGTEYDVNKFQKSEKNHPFYDPIIEDYMINKPTQIRPDLIVCGELKILATTTRPTNGMSGYHSDKSIIVGHNKIELQCLATAQGQTPKIIYSTGTVSQKKYIQKRAGQRAENRHCISALFVETCLEAQKGYQVRQLHWCDNHFTDLDVSVYADGYAEAAPADAVTFGDVHAEKLKNWDTLNQALKLATLLNTRRVITHDTFDFTSRNHHNIDDPWFFAKNCQISIGDDLQKASDVLEHISGAINVNSKIFVVRSNHDEALDRFLTDRKYDYRNDPVNARLYLDLQSAAYSYIEKKQKVPEMFKLALDVSGIGYPENVNFLTRKCNLQVNGVILSIHGDRGKNGSRGTPAQMAATYDKCSTGHTHQSSIYDGCYTSGVLELMQGYNENGGAECWTVSHTVQYANGSRAIIIY
jgi:hypothetical protein